jgi:hypothetical protein
MATFVTADAAERLARLKAQRPLGVSASIARPLTYSSKRPGIYDILKSVPGPRLSTPVNTGSGVSMGGQQNPVQMTVEPTRAAVRRAVGDFTAIPGVGKPSASPTAADIRSGNWLSPTVDYVGLGMQILPSVKPAYEKAKNIFASLLSKPGSLTRIAPEIASIEATPLSNIDYLKMVQRHRSMRFREDQLPELFSSAKRYWGQDYPQFQGYLREPKEVLPFLTTREQLSLKTDVAQIDELFKKAPPINKPVVVYRGLRRNWNNNNSSFFRMLDSLKPGDVFAEPGFSSTTIDPGLGRGFSDRGLGGYVLEIEVPQGNKIVSPLHGWPKQPTIPDVEKEFLLPRNSRFKVISRDGKTIRVQLLNS